MASSRAEALEQQVARVREAGVLGRSHGLARLFDYMADPAHQGRSLREADVAADVFGREVELSGDASVRVYIHRLRRKLEDFYAGPGAGEPHRLVIPVGDYRLDVADAAPAEAGPGPAPRRARSGLAMLAVLLVAVNVAGWLVFARAGAPARDLARAAAAPLWAGLGRERPVVVVIGDYYIFGDTEGGVEPRRMVREFDVNSAADLDNWLMDNPQMRDRYIDLDTYYTPVGATLAMREVMPLVRQAAGDAARVRVTTSSHLTTEMMKASDIVYVGYLSSLRLLQGPVFERSRFRIGSTYDELVEKKTGRSFTSGAGAASGDTPNRDYGYIAAFRGPAGNRFVVIAGNRDIGVMQTAEIAADPRALKALPGRGAGPLEALYAVDGLGRTAIAAQPVDPSK